MKHAFSLVELSIVLVILGLLTGGILTGQSLIRASELRAVTTEFDAYKTAVMTFRGKYFALPGDMNNAIDFWGAVNVNETTCGTTQGTGTQTCNGDGDGEIDVLPNSGTDSSEPFRAWQHLANAELLAGSFTGIDGSVGNSNDAAIGENVPASKLGNAGWMLRFQNGGAGATSFEHLSGNALTFGADAGTTSHLNAAAITPEEAWNIDTKIDDSKPGTGKVFVINWDECTDAATNGGANDDEVTAEYLLSEASTLCALRFINVF